MDKLADLAVKFGPNVIEAARAAAQMEARSVLIGGAILIAAGLLLILLAAILVYFIYADHIDDVALILVMIFVIAGVAMLGAGAWNWIDPWTWTALHHPDVWLAKKALQL